MADGGLYSSYIANCVFNALASLSAVLLNSVTIHALRKTLSLPTPLKTLLLSLAVSDLAVGLLVQPLYIAFCVMEMERPIKNYTFYSGTYYAFLVTGNLFFRTSFFGVTALSLDRYLAIHFHLRYQDLVNHKRVVLGVVSIWVFSAILSLLRLWTPDHIIFLIFAIIEVACLITAAFLNYNIFVAIRRHVYQVQALEVQPEVAQNVEMTTIGRMRKSANATVCVYLVFLVCYLPNICALWIRALTSEPSAVKHFKMLTLYFLTLLFLNSSLNPLIYCWKMDIKCRCRYNFFKAFSYSAYTTTVMCWIFE